MRLKGAVSISVFLIAVPVAAQDDFHGCGMAGTAKHASIKAVNQLKNRHTAPADADLDAGVTLEAVLAPGDDTDRFSEDSAAEIVGYVHDVKDGGTETCNCGATDPAMKDTHIELVPSVSLNDKTHRVIVEVTPRWRETMAAQGEDWSTSALKTRIKHKWIRVRGWLLFDVEHVGNANHTNPGGSNVWRATVWEVHPITKLEVVAAP